MPATSAVFLSEVIPAGLVAVACMVVVISVSFSGLMSYRGSLAGASGWPGST